MRAPPPAYHELIEWVHVQLGHTPHYQALLAGLSPSTLTRVVEDRRHMQAASWLSYFEGVVLPLGVLYDPSGQDLRCRERGWVDLVEQPERSRVRVGLLIGRTEWLLVADCGSRLVALDLHPRGELTRQEIKSLAWGFADHLASLVSAWASVRQPTTRGGI